MTSTAIAAAAPLPPDGGELLTELQVCALVKLRPRTIQAYVASKRFPQPIRFGKGPRARKRWRRSTVDNWIRGLEAEGKDEAS